MDVEEVSLSSLNLAEMERFNQTMRQDIKGIVINAENSIRLDRNAISDFTGFHRDLANDFKTAQIGDLSYEKKSTPRFKL